MTVLGYVPRIDAIPTPILGRKQKYLNCMGQDERLGTELHILVPEDWIPGDMPVSYWDECRFRTLVDDLVNKLTNSMVLTIGMD